MKPGLFKTFAICAVGLALAAVSFAQEQDEREKRAAVAASSIYVISAKAGGVNFVSGKVAVARKDATGGYLVKGDELEIGDKVSTGADGKAEILLNPGSYVRLGENTEFEFVTTSLDDLKVKIKRGSAIFEVLADNEFRVAVAAPNADFYLVKTGVYRVDVPNAATAGIEVWKGRAQVGDGQTEILKNGQSATVSGGQTMVAKFDRDEKDPLELWSKDRAKELAKINSRLTRSALRNSLLSNRGWSIYDAFGLWIYDPFSRTRCFLPFGYGWRSPYGYWFGRDLWGMQLPWYYYTQPNTTQPQTNNPNLTAKTPRVIQNQSDQPIRKDDSMTARTPRNVSPPPFMIIQRDFGIDRAPIRGTGNDDMIVRPSADPVRVAPPSMPPPLSPAPAGNTTAKPSRGN